MSWLARTLKTSICIITLFCVVQSAYAEQSIEKPDAISTHIIKYEVYAGGINAVTANLIVKYLNDTEYYLKLDASTAGLLGKLAPWQGIFETKGWLYIDDETGARPELHKVVSVWRDEKEILLGNAMFLHVVF